MSIESVTQAVSNLALEFGDDDARKGAMVSKKIVLFLVSSITLQQIWPLCNFISKYKIHRISA